MKLIKKLLAVSLMAAMSLSFAACSNDDKGSDVKSDGGPVTGAAAATTDGIKVEYENGALEKIDLYMGGGDDLPIANIIAGNVVTDASGKIVTTTDANATTTAPYVPKTAIVTGTDAAGNSVTSISKVVETAPPDAQHVQKLKEEQAFWMDLSKKSDYTFEGDMLTYTFRIKQGVKMGEVSPIKITFADFANYGDPNPQKVVATLLDGSVTVGSVAKVSPSSADGFYMSANDAAGMPGDEVTINLSVKNNPGVIGFIIRFDYDENLLELVSKGAGEAFANKS
jgi:predicted small secreted protein